MGVPAVTKAVHIEGASREVGKTEGENGMGKRAARLREGASYNHGDMKAGSET
jgi:hypothetical protein